MAMVAFDTLKFVKKLELAGVPSAQAEAISQAVHESHDAVDVATKRDLEDVRKELKSDIALVRQDLEAKIDKIGLQLTVRLGSMLVAAVGILIAVIKYSH